MAAPPNTVPCGPWVTDADVRVCCPDLELGFDLTDVITFASALLFRLSGRQYPGECTRLVYPCKGDNGGCGCSGGLGLLNTSWWWLYNSYPAYPFPNGDGTGFVNIGRCGQKCNLNRVKLPSTVNEIIEIIIDGVVLDPSAYKIEAYRWVARVDGGKWPCSNLLTGEPGDPGVWTIEYSYGKPPPADAKTAAAIFACELAKARCGAENCLPARVKAISRQGIDLAFADPMTFLDNGEVGIYEVDLWLKSVNPSKLKRRSRVHRPDRGKTNTSFT